jgi:diguanylate cyclase (GGDEF)-like protein/PAS domain S-box-containing protein
LECLLPDHRTPAVDGTGDQRSTATPTGPEGLPRETRPDEIDAWVETFSQIMAAGSVPTVLTSTAGTILHPNAAYTDLAGRSADELVGLPLAAMLHPEDLDAVGDPGGGALQTMSPESGRQRRHLRADGTVRVVVLSTREVRTDDGVPLGFFTQLEDVTARHDAEVRLAASEEMFRLAMDNAPIGMSLATPDGRWLRVNRALCRIVGRTEEEMRGLTFRDITHPDDMDTDLELLHRITSGEVGTCHFHKRYLKPDGSSVWARLSGAVARREDGEIAYLIVQVEDVTEERRAGGELAAQEARFRLLADGADDVVSTRIRSLPERRVEYISRGITAITGWSPEDFYADPDLLTTVVHGDDAAALEALFADPTRLRGGPVTVRFWRDDGTVMWVQSRGVPIHDDDGTVVGAELLSWDVTARHEAEHAVAASERRFRALVEHAADVVAILDADGVIRYVSPAVTRILGDDPDDLVGSTSMLRLPDDQVTELRAAIDRSAAEPDAVVRMEVQVRHLDGSNRWLAAAVTNRLDDPDIAGLVLNIHDGTDQRAAQQSIAYQASHDALTGLPNRLSLQRHLQRSLAEGRVRVDVLFVDLTGLKPVNDTLGHAKGDAVLRVVAARLSAVVAGRGTLGRFGGDEFVVVTDGLRLDELNELAECIVTELDLPITAPDGGQVHLTASVGIALGDDTSTAGQLLANADLAMGVVKRCTGRGVQLFDTDLADQATVRLSLERDLRGADFDRDFRVHYQPIVELGTGCVVSVEALLRWQHQERGLVRPSGFISIAEETGLIDRLGLWVLTQACRQQVAWAQHGVSVGVNLSPRQLYDPDLARRVEEVLSETGASAERLVLEVTESALIDDRVARPALTALKDLGLQLALDDFGTGYSSLTSLRRYPFDRVKVDRSFVAEIEDCAQDLAIVRNLVKLVHDLGMRVVAEGVETDGQLGVLRDIEADDAQGFLLGLPAEAEAVYGLLVAGSRALGPAAPRLP